MTEKLYGCIEAGGAKCVVGIVAAPDDIRETVRFETGTPDETINAVIAWLNDAQSHRGPLELCRNAANWGYITTTSKAGWNNSDFAGRVGRELGLRVGFDTDVNGAALAEARWGRGRSIGRSGVGAGYLGQTLG